MRPHVFAIQLPVRFRGIDCREGVIFEGPVGWSEFSPFREYEPHEAASWWRAAVDSAQNPWPTPVRDVVPVNCTVPVVDPDRAQRIVIESGCRTAKLKVADARSSHAEDVERVAAVRDALGPTGHIRVDANGLWDVETAVRSIADLDAAGQLEYVEQPVADVRDLAMVRRRVSVPIAADESIRRADDPYLVRDLDAADIAVLKVQPLGGVQACLRIAEEIGLPVVVSSAVETSVGLAAGLALAAALPDLPHACGLATTSLLSDDVVAEPLRPIDGLMRVGRVVPDAHAMERVQADADTTQWWLDRLERVRAVVDHAGASRTGERLR